MVFIRYRVEIVKNVMLDKLTGEYHPGSKSTSMRNKEKYSEDSF